MALSKLLCFFVYFAGQNDSECKTLNTKGLPILALRNMVLFPGVAIPVNVGRTKSLQLIKDAQNSHTPIGVVCQRDAAVEDPEKDDLYEVGVIGEIIKILEMPDESTTVILQGKMKRFRIDEITETFPYMRANVSLENEILPDANDKEFEACSPIFFNSSKVKSFKAETKASNSLYNIPIWTRC